MLCPCLSLKKKHVRRAVADGASTVAKVYRLNGKKARCGKCARKIKKLIEKYS
ncbi:MAG: (2Fe-2S)-binding protein [Deltaproteobacteria bacterium]|nr:(2Fe-2S)-binding protein [Deltaproteobacteria bacterium]